MATWAARALMVVSAPFHATRTATVVDRRRRKVNRALPCRVELGRSPGTVISLKRGLPIYLTLAVNHSTFGIDVIVLYHRFQYVAQHLVDHLAVLLPLYRRDVVRHDPGLLVGYSLGLDHVEIRGRTRPFLSCCENVECDVFCKLLQYRNIHTLVRKMSKVDCLIEAEAFRNHSGLLIGIRLISVVIRAQCGTVK